MTKISTIACATVLIMILLCINGHPLARSPNQSQKMMNSLDNLMSSAAKVKRKLEPEYVDSKNSIIINYG